MVGVYRLALGPQLVHTMLTEGPRNHRRDVATQVPNKTDDGREPLGRGCLRICWNKGPSWGVAGADRICGKGSSGAEEHCGGLRLYAHDGGATMVNITRWC